MDVCAHTVYVEICVSITGHTLTQTHTHTGEHAGPNTSGDGEDAASSIDWCSVRASVRSCSNEVDLVTKTNTSVRVCLRQGMPRDRHTD